MKSTDQLTPRQVQVIELMAEGLSAKQIADRLGTAVTTVQNQQFNAYKRIGASNAASCVAKFVLQQKQPNERPRLPCDL